MYLIQCKIMYKPLSTQTEWESGSDMWFTLFFNTDTINYESKVGIPLFI